MEHEKTGEGTWFLDILTKLSLDLEQIEVAGTPEEMIDGAAAAAFRISSAAGALPGAFGMAAIIPQVAAISRLQIRLVHQIAGYYGKPQIVNQELILMIFANVLGVAAGESFVKKAGSAVALRIIASGFAKRLSQKLGVDLLTEVAEKNLIRWIPVVTAPVFGVFSRSMTARIGREADAFFRRSQVEAR